MAASRQFSVTLPMEMALALDEKVRSGDYASPDDVLREGLEALLERETSVERWLREEVSASYDAHVADPTSAIALDQAMGRLRQKTAARSKDKPEA